MLSNMLVLDKLILRRISFLKRDVWGTAVAQLGNKNGDGDSFV